MSQEVTDPYDVRLSFPNPVQCFGLMFLMTANDLYLREPAVFAERPAVFVEGPSISSYHLPEAHIVLNCASIAVLFVVSAFSLFPGKEPVTRFLFLVQAGAGMSPVAFGLRTAEPHEGQTHPSANDTPVGAFLASPAPCDLPYAWVKA